MKAKVKTRQKRKGVFKRFKESISKVNKLNIVLIFVGLFFVWFNYQMLEIFKSYGSIPETYACAVIAATIGECGICGWIKTNKDKRQAREWAREDRKRMEETPEDDYNTGL